MKEKNYVLCIRVSGKPEIMQPDKMKQALLYAH